MGENEIWAATRQVVDYILLQQQHLVEFGKGKRSLTQKLGQKGGFSKVSKYLKSQFIYILQK